MAILASSSDSSNHKRLEQALQSGSETTLCEACKTFGVETYFYSAKKDRWERVIGYELDLVKNIASRPDCSFCSICLAVLHRRYHGIPQETWYDRPCLLAQYVHHMGAPQAIACVIPTVKSDREATEIETTYPSTAGLMLCCITPDEKMTRLRDEHWKNGDPRNVPWLGRPCTESTIDWKLIETWLGKCETNHGRHCEPIPPERKNLPAKLVDVEQMLIVDTPLDAQWVTLSYVWGDRSLVKASETQNRTLDLENLPKTIADAIRATKMLSMRYIWIDLLCIDQEDELEKCVEIAKLASIYQAAALCIVALDAADINQGLSGMTCGTRNVHQKFSRLPKTIIMSQQASYDNIYATSAWKSRGWTFQEQIMSKRCLYFSREQMFFRCQCENYAEDMEPFLTWEYKSAESRLQAPAELFRNHTAFKYNTLEFSTEACLIIDEDSDNIFDRYASAVEAYSDRKLSYEEDVLGAFSGVASLLAQRFETETIFGMPASCMLLAMLWQNDDSTSPAPPRPVEVLHYSTHELLQKHPLLNLPTWSWARWGLSKTRHLETYHASLFREMEDWEYPMGTVDLFACFSETPNEPFQISSKLQTAPLITRSKEDLNLQNITEAIMSIPKSMPNTLLLIFSAQTVTLRQVLENFERGVEGINHLPGVKPMEKWSTKESDDSLRVSPGFENCAFVSLVAAPRYGHGRDEVGAVNTIIVRWNDGIAYRVGEERFQWKLWEGLEKIDRTIVLA